MAPRARDALDAVIAAARANDVETMDARLAMDDDRLGASLVDARDREGRRAMHHASALGCVDVVEALARRHGAEVDAEDDDGRGALTHAAANARDECVKFLIDTCDAWIDASDCNDDTALTAACRQGEASTVEILLARGADARARNADGCDAFAEALCVRGDVEMARLLIQSGVNPKRSRVRCGGDGANASRSALNAACGLGNLEAARFLIDECGLDAGGSDCADSDYMTPLMAASLTAQVEVIEYLLLSGAAATAHLTSEDDLTAADMFPKDHARQDVKRKLEAVAVKASKSTKVRSVVAAPRAELPTKWAKSQNSREGSDPLEVRLRSWIAAGVEKYEGVPQDVRLTLEKHAVLTKEIELRTFLLGMIEDEMFQSDMQIKPIREAVHDVISNFHNVTKYRDNARVMNVLTKFRHVQRFCKDRGEKITFDDVLAADEEEVEQHRERLAELKAAAGVLWDEALMALRAFTTGENIAKTVMSQTRPFTTWDRITMKLLDLFENVAVHSIASVVFAVMLYLFWSFGGFQRTELASFAT